MSTQKFSPLVVQAAVAEGMKCKADSYTPLQGRPNSTLKYKDDLNVYLDYHSSRTQVEKPRALWKLYAAVESGPTICPSKVPDAVGVSVLLQGPFLWPWEACSAYHGPLDLW